MDFAELLAAASAALSAPSEIVGRSARARATASGVPPEQILAGWAGVDAGTTAPAPAAAPAAAEAPAAAPVAEAGPAELDVEVVAASEPLPEPKAEPGPEPEIEPEEEPEEVLVGAPGIREMRRNSLPRWLAAVFFVVPLVALFYGATFASGPGCGNGGALAIDPVTGVAENCDGSEFGSLGGNPLKLGAALYTAEAAPTCQSCHGADGGGGTGPAFAGGAIVETFPSCADHIQWVTLGTNRWREEVGDTYGASAKPVGGGGVMQSYEDSGLTAEEIAAVVLFERVTFGGLDAAEAEADCFGSGEDAEAAGG
jgi:hypothetical protein